MGAIPAFRALSASETAGYSQLDAQTLNKSGIYGFLISPDPQAKNTDLLNCNDIVKYSTNASETFVIDKGTVYPIFANSSAALPDTYLISASGSGINSDGQYVSHSVSDALTLASRNGQSAITILINSATALSQGDVDALAQQTSTRAITFKSASGTVFTLTTASGVGQSLTLNGNITFNKIDVSALTITSSPDATITFIDSIAGALQINGGDVSIIKSAQSSSGSSISAPSGVEAAVVLKGGNIRFETAATPAVSVSGGGAAFMIYGGRATIAADLQLASGTTLYPDPTTSMSGIPSKAINLIDNHSAYITGNSEPLTEFEKLSKKAVGVSTACSETGCTVVASCPGNLEAKSGYCETTDHYPLASFGIDNTVVNGKTVSSYVCDWASYVPVQNYNSQSPAYRTPQNATATVSCVNP